MRILRKHHEAVALALILLLAAFLSAYRIWDLGYSNEFYAASVKSMLTGWKNFFFASLDPGGWITVDKPPVSLWVQTAFAKVFGFYGWSIVLPQSLAAVGTVAVIYRAVKRQFGGAAGLISALVLALSPIFIIVSKTNNTDSVLIFFMALSAWAMVRACEQGRLRDLVLSMVFLGIAYNAKTLEAFLILPALFAVYLFGAKARRSAKIRHLAVAMAVLLAVSLSWSAAVDLTPADQRPYVDNSTNNSELELALGYNGIQRLMGQSPGTFSANRTDGKGQTSPPFSTGEARDGQWRQAGSSGTAEGSKQATSPLSELQQGSAENSKHLRMTGETGFAGGLPGGGGPGGGNGGRNMFNGGGSASPLRLFNTALGGQDSWLLPFGLFSAFAMIVGMRKAEEERRRKLLCGLLLWGGSVLTMVCYFSVAQFFHPYYLSAMAPYLAALTGIGATELWKRYRGGERAGYLLPAGIAVTLFVQVGMLHFYAGYSKILIPAVCAAAGLPALLLFFLRLKKRMGGKLAAVCAAIGLAGLLVAPAVWTGYSALELNFSSSIPSAGPSAESTSMFGQVVGGRRGMPFGNPSDSSAREIGSAGGNRGGSSSNSVLLRFLEQNNTGEKYLVAVPSASEAEPMILATGKPVIAVGGFSGTNRSLTVEKLEQLVKSGQLKYYMVGGRGGMGGNSSDEVTQWVEKHGKKIDSSVWSSASEFGQEENGSQALYDLSSYQSQ